ncbi:sulfatase [Verrucomicrobiota bacterium]
MKRREFLKTFVLSGAAVGVSTILKAENSSQKPNIVLLLADDLGWTGGKCFGSKFYETPNLDRLATQGMYFDFGYANMMHCAPSRASIMSGQYTPRHKVMYVSNFQKKWKAKNGDLKRFKLLQPEKNVGVPFETATIAETLKKAGYTTAMFGKWHLGYNKSQHPSKRGFDEAIVSSGRHWNFETNPPVEHDPKQYLSDFLGDKAISFMERSHADGKPFFLYLPDFLVHGPFETKKEYLDHFTAKEKSEHHKSPIAGAMIKSLDDTVGRVLKKLDELGIAKNTLVIFTSDNGGLAYQEDGQKLENTSNWPAKLAKGSEFDGGLRVPYIFRWPGRIPAGTLCKEPITGVDLYPTLLNVAGAKRPDQPLDGADLGPVLRNPKARLNERDIFWYLPLYSYFSRPCVVIRRGDWKLIHLLESGEYELYHTGNDIGEKNNVVAENSALAKEMNSRVLKWLEDTNAPRMLPNPEYDPEWNTKKKK